MSTRNYEAMFILDHNAASADFEATAATVDQILDKHGANVVKKEKWDERKLAYEIKGHRRGTYYLTYFTAEPAVIANINEDVRLSEPILRHMVIVLDGSIENHLEVTAVEREKLAEDSRNNALGGWGSGRRGSERGGRGRGRDDDDDEFGDDDDRPYRPARRGPAGPRAGASDDDTTE